MPKSKPSFKKEIKFPCLWSQFHTDMDLIAVAVISRNKISSPYVLSRTMRIASGTYCAALNCHVNHGAFGKKVSMFRFPKDPERCMKWIMNSKRLDFLYTDPIKLNQNHRLCSRHFEDKMFMNPKQKIALVHNAVPTLFEFDETDDTLDKAENTYVSKESRKHSVSDSDQTSDSETETQNASHHKRLKRTKSCEGKKAKRSSNFQSDGKSVSVTKPEKASKKLKKSKKHLTSDSEMEAEYVPCKRLKKTKPCVRKKAKKSSRCQFDKKPDLVKEPKKVPENSTESSSQSQKVVIKPVEMSYVYLFAIKDEKLSDGNSD